LRYCVDASAVLAALITVQRTPPVMAFWSGLSDEDVLLAQFLLFPECTSVLRTKAFDELITDEESLEMISDMLGLRIQISNNPQQFAQAVRIAQATRRKKAYDMQYVAVAVLERCEMVTLDGGVYQAAREQRIDARLLP
jgi:predicted nucleic acid-binding protein